MQAVQAAYILFPASRMSTGRGVLRSYLGLCWCNFVRQPFAILPVTYFLVLLNALVLTLSETVLFAIHALPVPPLGRRPLGWRCLSFAFVSCGLFSW